MTANSTWHHLRRSPFQSLAAIIVIYVCFLFLNFFYLFSSGASNLLKFLETKPEITIYLKDGLDKSIVEGLQKELTNYPSIREIKFISKEKALSIYKESNKDNPLLTEMVTSSILPASFEVSTSDPKVLDQIYQNFTSKTKEIDEIIYQKEDIEKILKWTAILRNIGFAIAILSIIFTVSIVSTIIGMKIISKKEEIKISRLLGASKKYVKSPFLNEGSIYGIIGSSLSNLTILVASLSLQSKINSFFELTFIPTDPIFYLISFFVSVVSGLLLGLVSISLAVNRYIKF
ncbi:MAG TPA: permease-like cell division protein FtsX [Candidatus Woesebacteria bacterium]|nr:permease-like cell division protein FtsX [Candidatus Woesebacteria bacterium]